MEYRSALTAITRCDRHHGVHHRRFAIGLPYWFFRLPIFQRIPSRPVLSTVSSMISPPRSLASVICWSLAAALLWAACARRWTLNGGWLGLAHLSLSVEPGGRWERYPALPISVSV